MINQLQIWVLLLGLLCPLLGRAEQFVELTAEIEVNDWGYWFLEDGFARPATPKTSIFTPRRIVRCIVGTNTWMMTGDFYSNTKATYWFTGTNIIEQTVLARRHSDATKKALQQNEFLTLPFLPVDEKLTRAYEAADGNPGRPVRVSDLLHTLGNISWLAFCSGSFLKHDDRKIYPPSDIWKEIGPWPFTDKTEVFEDGLRLPRSVRLFAPNNQTVFQYQVHQSTNFLGWSFPLEFYLVQYVPARTNGYQVRLTAKGKVTAIKEGTKPVIPDEVLKAVQK